MENGGQNLHQILDTRAAVYEKLGQYKDALKDAKKTIDTAPERWQGYARAARVFHQLNRPESAQTMITMALERLKETEVERRVSLLSLQENIHSLQKALDARKKLFTAHITQLPIEVFGEIARMVVEDDHTALIPLLQVCKCWRVVIENTPHLWAKLILTSRRPRPKAKLWIERTKGRVTELVVRSGAAWSFNWPGSSLDGLQWDNLLVFHSEGWAFLPYLLCIGKEAAVTKWTDLTMEGVDGVPIPLLRGQSFSLRSLCLDKVKVDLNGKDICEQITGLRSCTIRKCSASGSWANVLKANPLLERLELNTIASTHAKPLQSRLELDRLTSLEAVSSVPIDIFTARMPHLRSLTLGIPLYDPDVFIRHLTDTLIEGLSELRLHSCGLNGSTNLLLLLRRSPDLRVLEVTGIAIGITRLLDALAAHYKDSDDPAYNQSLILCPKLTHVNVSGCPEVQAGLLMRLIKSRTTASAEGVAKIDSLIIDFCPNVEKEWVKRMEELVPHVSCCYTTRQMAKRRIRV